MSFPCTTPACYVFPCHSQVQHLPVMCFHVISKYVQHLPVMCFHVIPRYNTCLLCVSMSFPGTTPVCYVFPCHSRVQHQFPDFRQHRAIINHDGRIRWEPAGVFETFCQIDITLYPYDYQQCAIVFGTWSYTSYKVLTHIIPLLDIQALWINKNYQIYKFSLTFYLYILFAYMIIKMIKLNL